MIRNPEDIDHQVQPDHRLHAYQDCYQAALAARVPVAMLHARYEPSIVASISN
jgi:hypothetical protein